MEDIEKMFMEFLKDEYTSMNIECNNEIINIIKTSDTYIYTYMDSRYIIPEFNIYEVILELIKIRDYKSIFLLNT
jgi:succinate dehydrogenase flavin-adding protein (antitoxin of CptAB toxin-antitoxin module)